MSNGICARVFKNSFFKKEKLTHDTSISVNGNGCVKARNSLQNGQSYVGYIVEYKSCYAKRKNDDGTEFRVKVYLQSAYKQPILGRYKYFVLFKYFFDQRTGLWLMPNDPNYTTGEGKFRYEGYLSL